VTEKFARI